MGNNYNPHNNWKSRHRARAGFPVVPYVTHNKPTFSFVDAAGTFTRFLFANCASFASSEREEWIDKRLKYHLDVKTTRGSLQEEFEVSEAMLKRAKEWSIVVQQMKSDVGEAPKDVYVLVRIHDMAILRDEDLECGEKGKGKEYSGPQMSFLIDPWEAYHKDRLSLRSRGGMIGSIV